MLLVLKLYYRTTLHVVAAEVCPPFWCQGRCATMAHIGLELVGGEQVKVSASLWKWRARSTPTQKTHGWCCEQQITCETPPSCGRACPLTPCKQVRAWLPLHNASQSFSAFATKPGGRGEAFDSRSGTMELGVVLKACGGLNQSHLWRAKNANPHL